MSLWLRKFVPYLDSDFHVYSQAFLKNLIYVEHHTFREYLKGPRGSQIGPEIMAKEYISICIT